MCLNTGKGEEESRRIGRDANSLQLVGQRSERCELRGRCTRLRARKISHPSSNALVHVHTRARGSILARKLFLDKFLRPPPPPVRKSFPSLVRPIKGRYFQRRLRGWIQGYRRQFYVPVGLFQTLHVYTRTYVNFDTIEESLESRCYPPFSYPRRLENSGTGL